MANSWPAVSGTTTGYKVQGTVTTIRWGTDGILQNPVPSSGFLVVLRANQRRLVDNIKLMNGTGVTVTRAQVTDGVVWDLTVRDDTSMFAATGAGATVPDVGITVTITDMAGIIKPTSGDATVGQVFNGTVVEHGYETAPKQAGERTITVENLLLVESQVKGSPI